MGGLPAQGRGGGLRWSLRSSWVSSPNHHMILRNVQNSARYGCITWFSFEVGPALTSGLDKVTSRDPLQSKFICVPLSFPVKMLKILFFNKKYYLKNFKMKNLTISKIILPQIICHENNFKYFDKGHILYPLWYSPYNFLFIITAVIFFFFSWDPFLTWDETEPEDVPDCTLDGS